ncbi:MAG: MarR family winged helix-turn-helix transcriptional regulator [Limnohabitans sp.]
MSDDVNMQANADHEFRAHADQHASLRLWLRLLSCTTRVEDKIRQKLRESFDITLPRFDLMAQLERHPDGLSMGELSRRMMVTGGNITTIVDQLEKEKLVLRVVGVNDRRSFTVKLTQAGKDAFTDMAIAHEAWVADLFEGLPVSQQTELYTLLGAMKRNLQKQEEMS